MGRIAEKNPRYRTKEEICEDIAFILSSYMAKKIKWGTAFAVLHEVIWIWSEFDGKYHTSIRWSHAALALAKSKKGLGRIFN